MKVLVIFTGGTIGSSVKGKWVSVDNVPPFALLSRYNDTDDEFVTLTPYSVLSENLSSEQINLLQKEIEKNLDKDFDGIIVTHGTDTLQYAACAAEFAFGNSAIPIVFVSADFPLENEATNGFFNFEAAMEFIRSGTQGGVFVSYKNDDKNEVDIHIPSRILSHGECDPNIYSIDKKIFASYKDGRIQKNMELKDEVSPIGVVEYKSDSKILCIDSYPANNYLYALDNIDAIVLKPYHSATLNTSNEKLADFCKRAENAKIPVFLVNVKSNLMYESSKEFNELNINVLPYGTFISSYMKIWAGLSLEKDLNTFMKTPISYEIV